MKKLFRTLLVLSVLSTTFLACKKPKKDDPAPENPVNPGGGDEESFSRIELKFTDSANTANVFIVKYRTTGSDTIKLNPNKTYLSQVFIYDDTKNPVNVISDEIKKEQNYHRFHYTFTPVIGSGASLQSFITDLDTNVPQQMVGLTFKLKAGTGFGNGTLNMNLRHFANGIPKDNNPAGGEQDLSINFVVKVAL